MSNLIPNRDYGPMDQAQRLKRVHARDRDWPFFKGTTPMSPADVLAVKLQYLKERIDDHEDRISEVERRLDNDDCGVGEVIDGLDDEKERGKSRDERISELENRVDRKFAKLKKRDE